MYAPLVRAVIVFGMVIVTNLSLNDAASAASGQVTYATVEAQGLSTRLIATVDGQSYEVISDAENLCLKVVDQGNYDGSGLTAALIENVIACGGNGAANSFFFVAYVGNGHFERSHEFGYSWTEPFIERWNGRPSVRVLTTNEGMNTDDPLEVMERYVLDAGSAVKVEESVRKSLIAQREMKSSEFGLNSGSQGQSLSFDLDGDGLPDVISGKPWQRWGRLWWSVSFSSGQTYDSSLACKRLGVLSTRTNGVNDLVCDQDDILRVEWRGLRVEQPLAFDRACYKTLAGPP